MLVLRDGKNRRYRSCRLFQADGDEVLPELYIDEATFLKALEAVSKEDIMRLAQSLKLQAQYFMKGEVYAEEEL